MVPRVVRSPSGDNYEGALLFDGDDHVDLGEELVGTAPLFLTVEAWIQPTSLPDGGVIFF